MSQAKEGDTVRVHYTGKLQDGTQFDSSRGRDPLEFKIGSEQVIPGFEEIVIAENMLAPVHVMTTLTGSPLLVIAYLEGRLTADEVWAATHVDETWQDEQWGEDAEALARRATRRAEFDAAVRFLELAQS